MGTGERRTEGGGGKLKLQGLGLSILDLSWQLGSGLRVTGAVDSYKLTVKGLDIKYAVCQMQLRVTGIVN